MDQYRPCYRAGEHPALDRRLTAAEYHAALAAAHRAGLHRLDGFTARP
jgi:putative pyruvate formate lyase activating enzyme